MKKKNDAIGKKWYDLGSYSVAQLSMRFADICESSYGGKTKTLEITLEISEPPVGIRMLIHLVWIIPGFVLLFSNTKEKS